MSLTNKACCLLLTPILRMQTHTHSLQAREFRVVALCLRQGQRFGCLFFFFPSWQTVFRYLHCQNGDIFLLWPNAMCSSFVRTSTSVLRGKGWQPQQQTSQLHPRDQTLTLCHCDNRALRISLGKLANFGSLRERERERERERGWMVMESLVGDHNYVVAKWDLCVPTE